MQSVKMFGTKTQMPKKEKPVKLSYYIYKSPDQSSLDEVQTGAMNPQTVSTIISF